MEVNIELLRRGYSYKKNNNFFEIKEKNDNVRDKYIEYLKISDGFRSAYNSNLKLKQNK